jgi:hypothetical protein
VSPEIDCGELQKLAGNLHKGTTGADLDPEEGTRVFGPNFSERLGVYRSLESMRSLGEYASTLQGLMDADIPIGGLDIFAKTLGRIYEENCAKKTRVRR